MLLRVLMGLVVVVRVFRVLWVGVVGVVADGWVVVWGCDRQWR